jgi:TPR repeat protein
MGKFELRLSLRGWPRNVPFVLAAVLFLSAVGISLSEDVASNDLLFEEVRRAVRMKDFIKASALLGRLAEGGEADAQYQLGVLYETGRGVPQNDAKALEYYRQAAEQGHAKAQYSLAEFYLNGRGTTADHQLAWEWYQRSARQGYVQASNKINRLNQDGGFTRYNTKLPREELLRLAAARNMKAEVIRLIQEGADINARDRFGRAPFATRPVER